MKEAIFICAVSCIPMMLAGADDLSLLLAGANHLPSPWDVTSRDVSRKVLKECFTSIQAKAEHPFKFSLFIEWSCLKMTYLKVIGQQHSFVIPRLPPLAHCKKLYDGIGREDFSNNEKFEALTYFAWLTCASRNDGKLVLDDDKHEVIPSLHNIFSTLIRMVSGAKDKQLRTDYAYLTVCFYYAMNYYLLCCRPTEDGCFSSAEQSFRLFADLIAGLFSPALPFDYSAFVDRVCQICNQIVRECGGEMQSDRPLGAYGRPLGAPDQSKVVKPLIVDQAPQICDQIARELGEEMQSDRPLGAPGHGKVVKRKKVSKRKIPVNRLMNPDSVNAGDLVICKTILGDCLTLIQAKAEHPFMLSVRVEDLNRLTPIYLKVLNRKSRYTSGLPPLTHCRILCAKVGKEDCSYEEVFVALTYFVWRICFAEGHYKDGKGLKRAQGSLQSILSMLVATLHGLDGEQTRIDCAHLIVCFCFAMKCYFSAYGLDVFYLESFLEQFQRSHDDNTVVQLVLDAYSSISAFVPRARSGKDKNKDKDDFDGQSDGDESEGGGYISSPFLSGNDAMLPDQSCLIPFSANISADLWHSSLSGEEGILPRNPDIRVKTNGVNAATTTMQHGERRESLRQALKRSIDDRGRQGFQLNQGEPERKKAKVKSVFPIAPDSGAQCAENGFSCFDVDDLGFSSGDELGDFWFELDFGLFDRENASARNSLTPVAKDVADDEL